MGEFDDVLADIPGEKHKPENIECKKIFTDKFNDLKEVINRVERGYNTSPAWNQKVFWINLENCREIDVIEAALDDQYRELAKACPGDEKAIVERIGQGLDYYEKKLLSYLIIKRIKPKKNPGLEPKAEPKPKPKPQIQAELF